MSPSTPSSPTRSSPRRTGDEPLASADLATLASDPASQAIGLNGDPTISKGGVPPQNARAVHPAAPVIHRPPPPPASSANDQQTRSSTRPATSGRGPAARADRASQPGRPIVPPLRKGRGAPARDKPRGRGRPVGPGPNAPPSQPPRRPAAPSLNALAAAAETIASEVRYAGFLNRQSREAERARAAARAEPTGPGGGGAEEPVAGFGWTHPALADDTSLDSEYARFVRSLIDNSSDDASVFSFKTLQSIKPEAAVDRVGTVVGDLGITVGTLEDGDDEDYMLTEEEESDDDATEAEEEKKDEASRDSDPASSFGTPRKPPLRRLRDDPLHGEIEGLMEEDLDAQLTSLLNESESSRHPDPSAVPVKIAIAGTDQQKAITSPGQSTKKKKSTQTVVTSPAFSGSPEASAHSTEGGAPAVTRRQLRRLRVAMAKHHQLLLQQAALAVRAAYVQKVARDAPRPSRSSGGSLPAAVLNSRSLTFCAPNSVAECGYDNDFYHGENAEELAECLDGAVGMLQDLEQNWKDAVRNSIQLSFSQGGNNPGAAQPQGGRRKLLSAISEETELAPEPEPQCTPTPHDGNNASERRLTRSAFTKTLLEREMEMTVKMQNDGLGDAVRHRISVFDIRGLARLRETFLAIDNSVKEVRLEVSKEENNAGINILHPADHGEACQLLLRHAGAEIDTTLVPGLVELSELVTHAPEAFSDRERVNPPLTKAQRLELRRNKSQFTAGEDNLILRGVNLYGEKEWVLVSDRFLPDRPVNSISQRYHRLCFLIYKSNGIHIDDDGKLAPLPTFKKGEEEVAALKIAEAVSKVKPPAPPSTMNVHRWTMEEDVAILKAVPIMGNQWAEICNNIIPHRDRGHIRKRYQVLERRIPKGTTKLSFKRPAPTELSREIAKHLKTTTQKAPKPPTFQKKVAPKKASSTLTKAPRAKQPTKSSTIPPKASNASEKSANTSSFLEPRSSPTATDLPKAFQPFSGKPHSSSFELIDEDDHERAAALLHKLSTPTRNFSQQLQKPLSQDHDSAKDLEYIFYGNDHSNEGETTRMGVEEILADDWSQASGMQRLLEAGFAESNFNRTDGAKPVYSPIKSSQLPEMPVDDVDASRLSMINEFNAADDINTESKKGARRSLLSSAMEKTKENATKRKKPDAPSERVERSVKVSGSPVKINLGKYVASPAPSSPKQENIFSEPFTLAAAYGTLTPRRIGTPGKFDTPSREGGKSQICDEAFQYFMTDDSPQKSATPSRLRMLPPNTPLNQLGYSFSNGGLSGPVDGGNNSLLMAGDDFDAVAALQDLSNSAPPTPSKLLLPVRRTGTHEGEATREKTDEEPPKPKTSFLSKVKAKASSRKA